MVLGVKNLQEVFAPLLLDGLHERSLRLEPLPLLHEREVAGLSPTSASTAHALRIVLLTVPAPAPAGETHLCSTNTAAWYYYAPPRSQSHHAM